MDNNFVTLARFAPTTWMTSFKKEMKANGYTVESAGDIVNVLNGDEVVARGLKMGKMGWMVRANPDAVKAA